MYFKMISALIKKGRVDGLEDKINYLWLDGKLNDSEHDELINMLKPKEEKSE